MYDESEKLTKKMRKLFDGLKEADKGDPVNLVRKIRGQTGYQVKGNRRTRRAMMAAERKRK